MRVLPTSILVVLGFTAGFAKRVEAQVLRTPFQASNGVLRTSGIQRKASQGTARIVSPREKLPADSAKKLAATPNVAYCVWVEQTTTGWDVQFRRSTTGGFTWEATQKLYTQTGIGTWDLEQIDIAATNHEVYVGMTTNGPGQAWPNRAWLIASEDQGQNWAKIQEISVNSKKIGQDAERIRMDASNGKAHIVFHFGDLTNNAALNDLWYVKAEFVNSALIFTPDLWVNNHQSKQFTEGARYFDVIARDPLVAISYTSPRVGAANEGNLYVVSDTASGTTLGKTATPIKITSYTTANPRTDQYWEPQLAVAFPNIYLVWGDNPVWPNAVFFTASYDFGKSYAKPVVINKGGVGADADGPVIAADGSLVCVAWHDSRDSGTSNLANRVFLAFDDKAGQDFLAGNVTEIRVDDPATLKIRTEWPQVAVRGDEVVLVYEKSPYDAAAAQNEDLVLLRSSDRGKTFGPVRDVTRIAPAKDIDNPQVTLTQNGDAIMSWADNTKSANDLYIGGFKIPEIVPLGNNKGLEVRAGAVHRGDLVFIAVTEKGTSPAFSLDNLGNKFNFAIGVLTPNFLGLPFLTAVSNATGTAAFPGIPDGPFGVHLIAVAFDVTNGKVKYFTDPLKF